MGATHSYFGASACHLRALTTNTSFRSPADTEAQGTLFAPRDVAWFLLLQRLNLTVADLFAGERTDQQAPAAASPWPHAASCCPARALLTQVCSVPVCSVSVLHQGAGRSGGQAPHQRTSIERPCCSPWWSAAAPLPFPRRQGAAVHGAQVPLRARGGAGGRLPGERPEHHHRPGGGGAGGEGRCCADRASVAAGRTAGRRSSQLGAALPRHVGGWMVVCLRTSAWPDEAFRWASSRSCGLLQSRGTPSRPTPTHHPPAPLPRVLRCSSRAQLCAWRPRPARRSACSTQTCPLARPSCTS